MAHRDFSETSPEKDQQSLVERLFFDPDTVCQGESMAIYDFLLSPDIRDNPAAQQFIPVDRQPTNYWLWLGMSIARTGKDASTINTF